MPGSGQQTRHAIVCIGAAHWDIVGTATQQLTRCGDVPGQIAHRPGGVALNVALGLADRGEPVRLLSAVGNDKHGRDLLDIASGRGVDCSLVKIDDQSTTGAYIAIEGQDGDLFAAIADVGPTEALSKDDMISLKDLPEETTLFLDANLSPLAIRSVADLARMGGRELVANPVSPAKACRLAPVLNTSLNLTLICNLEEANVMSGQIASDSETAAQHLAKTGARTAIVTNGRDRAGYCCNGGLSFSLSPPAAASCSVTGAGDAMIAAWLACADRTGDPRNALARSVGAATAYVSGHPAR